MYENLIWATDGSAGADAALREALRLAELSGGRITAVHCDQRLFGRGGGVPRLPYEEDIRVRLRRRVEELRDEGVDIDLVVRRSRVDAADTVAALASELGADVVVCGTRGLGALASVFLGSFTQRLLHIAPCPVLAVPELLDAEEDEHERVVVGANA
jgi:nucleotide-binding universal stress UspA family protein